MIDLYTYYLTLVMGLDSINLAGYNLTNPRDFLAHGAESKRLYTIVDQDGHKTEVVMKDVSRFAPKDRVPSEWYCDLWRTYVAASVPTHAWMVAYDETQIITPNLYTEGKRIFGKASFKSLPKMFFPVPPNMTDLLLIAVNEEEIRNAVEGHIETASEAGIILPYDDSVEIIINDNGEWNIMTLDLTMTSFVDDASEAYYVNSAFVQSAIRDIVGSQYLLSQIFSRSPELFTINHPRALSQPR